MTPATLLIMLASAAALVCNAMAQDAPAAPPPGPGPESYVPALSRPVEPNWSGDPRMPCCDLTESRSRRGFGAGVAALKVNDFARAEEIFDRILLYDGNNTAVRFYMGIAKMNLGKWAEAKSYLRTAARRWREQPGPKGHLGVAYAKLGDLAGANAQRERLLEMAEACRDSCELSPSITGGIRMIDEALAESALSSP